MLKPLAYSILAFICLPGLALAELPMQALQGVDDVSLVGKGRLSYYVWDVYDASLYAPNGEWKENKPFVLKLDYLRPISGSDIANTAIESMRLQGVNDEVKLAAWHSQMQAIFPDVYSGTSLTGAYRPSGEVQFFDGKGLLIGEIKDKGFAKHFFGIWLAPNTPKPGLRAKLLGQKTEAMP